MGARAGAGQRGGLGKSLAFARLAQGQLFGGGVNGTTGGPALREGDQATGPLNQPVNCWGLPQSGVGWNISGHQLQEATNSLKKGAAGATISQHTAGGSTGR